MSEPDDLDEQNDNDPEDFSGHDHAPCDACTNERDDLIRLRALIKQVERIDGVASPGTCPWCGSFVSPGKHADDCPAFTPDGTVR